MNAYRHRRFEALLGALLPDLYRYALWLCHDPALAEDLVQDCMLRAWRKLDSLRDDAAAKSWAITILRRELARHWERKRLDTVDVDAVPVADAAALGLDDAAEHANLRRAIACLPEKYREPLTLQVLLGHSVEEIAGFMELKVPTVLTRLFRARKLLAEALDVSLEVSA